MVECKCQYPGCGKIFNGWNCLAKWCPEHKADGIKMAARGYMRRRGERLMLEVKVCQREGCTKTFRAPNTTRRFCDECGRLGSKRGSSGRPRKDAVSPEPLFHRDPHKPVRPPHYQRLKVKAVHCQSMTPDQLVRLMKKFSQFDVDLI